MPRAQQILKTALNLSSIVLVVILMSHDSWLQPYTSYYSSSMSAAPTLLWSSVWYSPLFSSISLSLTSSSMSSSPSSSKSSSSSEIQYCHHNQILVIVVSQVVSFYCFGYQIRTFKLKIIAMRHTWLSAMDQRHNIYFPYIKYFKVFFDQWNILKSTVIFEIFHLK